MTALLEGELSGLYARPSSVIDDLAERRNSAAHGDEMELLDRPTLRAVVEFVKGYADALADDAFECLARVTMTQRATEIGRVEHTWAHPGGGGRSICGVRPATNLALAQQILIAGRRMRLATVESIQLDRVSLQAAGPSEERYGVAVGIPVHDGERLYAIETEELSLIEGLARPD